MREGIDVSAMKVVHPDLPKYLHLKEILRARITSGEWQNGAKLPAIHRLVGQYGVSTTTVVKALAELRRDEWVRGEQGKGVFVIKDDLASEVGIVIGFGTLEAASDFPRLLYHSLADLLEADGWHPRIHFVPPGQMGRAARTGFDRLVADLDQRRLRGLIVLGVTFSEELNAAVARNRCPVVYIGYRGGTGPHYRVVTDCAQITRVAIEHLYDQGARRIAVISAGEPPEHIDPVRRACRSAADSLGIPDVAIISVWPVSEGLGFRAMKRLLSGERHPHGVFIADDIMARGAADALVEMAVDVPGDLRLAVLVNKGSDVKYPVAVSRVELDAADVARAALDIIEGLIEGRQIPMQGISIKGHLVGVSHACPPGRATTERA